MKLFNRTLDELKRRRDKMLKGGVNCIPWGFPRFEENSPGIEQKNYYLVTANSKVGKSQITDYMFMHNAYTFVRAMEGDIKLKIFYFSLEMSDEQKLTQCLSHRLYIDSGRQIRLSPKQLRSTKEMVSPEIIEKVEGYAPYFEEFLDSVEFITNVKNPYGIFKHMKEYALSNGIQHKKEIEVDEKQNGVLTGNKVKVEVDDYYEPNNPDEYVMCIVDHASLLSPEKQSGGTLFGAINDFSSRHCVMMRNKYKIIPVLVQQQASAQESVENFKFNKLKPTFNGLADCKNTQRDIDLALGLFTPARHEMSTFAGYDIRFFRDNIRFMDIIGGREGGGGTVVPLFFDGAVNYFKELPRPDDIQGMQTVYNLMSQQRGSMPLKYTQI